MAATMTAKEAEAELAIARDRAAKLDAELKSGGQVPQSDWEAARARVEYLETALVGAERAEARRVAAEREEIKIALTEKSRDALGSAVLGVDGAMDALAASMMALAEKVDAHNKTVDEVRAEVQRALPRPARSDDLTASEAERVETAWNKELTAVRTIGGRLVRELDPLSAVISVLDAELDNLPHRRTETSRALRQWLIGAHNERGEGKGVRTLADYLRREKAK